MILEKKIFFKPEDEHEIVNYLGVNASFSFDFIKTKLEAVQDKEIESLLGNAFTSILLDKYYNDELSDLEKKLIHLIRFPLTAFAFEKIIPQLQLDISTSGIRIQSNSEYKTAFQWQILDLEKNVNRSAYEAMETLYLFLDQNLLEFPIYRHSLAYKVNHALFINTVKEFDNYRNIRGLRSMFILMRYIMIDVEQNLILKATGKSLFNLLKDYIFALPILEIEQSNGLDLESEAEYYYDTNFTSKQKRLDDILFYIKSAVANLTFARAIPELNLVYDEKGFLTFNTNNTQNAKAFKPAEKIQVNNLAADAKGMGDKALKDLIEFLKKNLEIYPEYAQSEAYQPDLIIDKNNKPEWSFHRAF